MSRVYHPFHEHIIVRRTNAEEITPGGIHIPEQHQDKPQEGVVLSVGTGYRSAQGLIPLEVKVGQNVVFGRYSGNDFKQQGEMVVILKEDELLSWWDEVADGNDESINPPAVHVIKKTGDERLPFLASLAAKYRAEGYSLPSTTASLRQDNEEQCEPAIAEAEISQLADAIFAE